jgi:hypothetical protein
MVAGVCANTAVGCDLFVVADDILGTAGGGQGGVWEGS